MPIGCIVSDWWIMRGEEQDLQGPPMNYSLVVTGREPATASPARDYSRANADRRHDCHLQGAAQPG
jgi:hypothetical protein